MASVTEIEAGPRQGIIPPRHSWWRRVGDRRELALPLAIGLGFLVFWELAVRLTGTPVYVLPPPSIIAVTLVTDAPTLLPAWWVTVKITFLALAAAIVGGSLLALLFSLSRTIEVALFPFAVILQVTPIIAIAPLIILWVPSNTAALLIIAWIVAFFPILSNTLIGLRSADHNLRDLMRLYGASRVQTLRFLMIPTALPFFLGGLKIAGGLSLIGAVVAEFVLGTSGMASGLAYRILEASYRLNVPRMFAAVVLVSLTGIAIFLFFSWLYTACLKNWHESVVKR